MDYPNESYVRLYTRDTTTWKRLQWEGQCVLGQLLRKVDRAGVLELGADLEVYVGVHLHMEHAPLEFVRAGVQKILELGVASYQNGFLVFPNFIAAQEASKSDKQRQRESRERRRDRAEEKPSQIVTVPSQPVTTGHSVLCSAVLCSADPDPDPMPAGANAAGGVERFIPSRPPVGDPPHWAADEVPVKPPVPDRKRVHDLYAEAIKRADGQVRVDFQAATDIAAAARVEAGSDDKVFEQVLRRIFRDWTSDPKAATHKLGNLALHITKYTREKKAPPKPTYVPPPPPESEVNPLLQELFAEYKSQAVA